MWTDSTSGLEFYPPPLVYYHRWTLRIQKKEEFHGNAPYTGDYPTRVKCDHQSDVFNVVLFI